mgnify:CR=1 FL=1
MDLAPYYSRVIYLNKDKRIYVVFDTTEAAVRLQSRGKGIVLRSSAKIPIAEAAEFEEGYDLYLKCPVCNFCFCELNELVINSNHWTKIGDFDCSGCERKRISYKKKKIKLYF